MRLSEADCDFEHLPHVVAAAFRLGAVVDGLDDRQDAPPLPPTAGRRPSVVRPAELVEEVLDLDQFTAPGGGPKVPAEPTCVVDALLADDLDPVPRRGLRVNVGVGTVGELHVPSHVLVFVAPRVLRAPSRHPLHVRVVGEQAQDTQSLAPAARNLVGRLVQVYALHRAKLAGVDECLDLPVLRHVAIGVPRRQRNPTRRRLLHHPVGLIETGGHRLLAVDRADSRPRAVDYNSRVRFDGQNRRCYVDVFHAQHLVIVVVGLDGEPLQENGEVRRIGVRRRHEIGARIGLVPSSVSVPLASRSDQADSILSFVGHSVLLAEGDLRAACRADRIPYA